MKRIILSLAENLLEDIDAVCKQEAYNRSEFIRKCVRDILYQQAVLSDSNYPSPKSIELTPDGPIPIEDDDKIKVIAKLASAKGIKTCKHGAALGNCKFGCKK